MLIEVLRQTMLSGRVVKVGEVVDASPADAKLLIGIGKAVEAVTQVTEAVKEIAEPTRKPTTTRRRAKS
jgi:hypothetical protein